MSELTPEEYQREIEELKRQLAEAKSGIDIDGNQNKVVGDRGVAVDQARTVQTGDGARDIDSETYNENSGTVVFAHEGSRVVIGGEEEVAMSAVERDSALGHYLQHIIGRNRYLQLQGIRSGGKLVHIELDRIFIRLRATRQRVVDKQIVDKRVIDKRDPLHNADQQWLNEAAQLAPGELERLQHRHESNRSEGNRSGHHSEHNLVSETVTVSVEEALAEFQRLVILGDPGSGKTTLMRYLALIYAQDLAQGTQQVTQKLGDAEKARLPILLYLRQIGAFLADRPNQGTDGHKVLLQFLYESLRNERIDISLDFFDQWLKSGEAIILLDGLDEVADPKLRQRVARLVESFTQAYDQCRYVVTSRIVGYSDGARLQEKYETTTVRDFSMQDVAQFLTNWHQLITIGQMGDTERRDCLCAGSDRAATLGDSNQSTYSRVGH